MFVCKLINKCLQFCTALGAAIVPMAFETVWDLTGSVQAAFIAAVYIIFGAFHELQIVQKQL